MIFTFVLFTLLSFGGNVWGSEEVLLKNLFKYSGQRNVALNEHPIVKRSIETETDRDTNVTILPWQPWTQCDATNCNHTGTQLRHRSCMVNGLATDSDTRCETNLSEQRPCRTACAEGVLASSWSEWNTWSSCPVTCGQGEQTRYRVCGVEFCSGSALESRPCFAEYTCPEWSQWLEWSPCTETCGNYGIKTRTKNCLQQRILHRNQTKNENLKQLFVSSNFSKSVEFDLCNQSESGFELGFCLDQPPCNYTWSNWTEWTECSESCGHGYQTSSRHCLSGYDCSGNSLRFRHCSTPPCWSQWTVYSPCPRSCEVSGGFQIRRRTCAGAFLDFEQNEGCVGNDTEITACDAETCSQWSRWSRYSNCSKTCNGGRQTRTRNCQKGVCIGRRSESRICNTQPCPTWSSWSSYTCCSETCGENGMKQRTRFCQFDYESTGCPGNKIERVPCLRRSCNATVSSVFDSFECGIRRERNIPKLRIIGGQESTQHGWPWQASWQYRRCGFFTCSSWSHLCGATLVAPEWLVTSGHCIEEPINKVDRNNPGNDWSVVLGMHRLYRDGERHFLSRVFVHEDYFYDYVTDADVALLKLREPVTLSSRISPVCFPHQSQPEVGESCVVTGWGFTEPPSTFGSDLATTLVEAEVPIMSFESCLNLGPDYEENLNETNHFCAGIPNNTSADSCMGDSGGPLVCRRNNSDQYYFSGITSFGFEECGTPGHVGVYTPVVSFEHWIRSTIDYITNMC